MVKAEDFPGACVLHGVCTLLSVADWSRSKAPPTGGGERGSWPVDLVEMCQRQRPLSPQVPQDDWGGYPTGGKDGEIPCRRMRSGSYIKAMGDEESGDSDGSPKTSPKALARRFASRRSSSVDQARIK